MTHVHSPVLPALDGVVVTAAGVEAFDCPVCGEVRDLVVPVCDDAPDGAAECPDRACAVCGLALATWTVPLEPAVDRRAQHGTRRVG